MPTSSSSKSAEPSATTKTLYYLEACRQLAYEEGENSVVFVALTYILEPGALGEQKSKAAQLGIKRLMEVGIMPHIIACRATNPVKEKVREKISMYTNVPMKRVVTMHDVESIYLIPEALREAGMDREVLTLLESPRSRRPAAGRPGQRLKWQWFVERIGKAKEQTSRSPSPENTPAFAMRTPASSRPANIARFISA